MNILYENFLAKFLKKLNTISDIPKLAKEFTTELAEELAAQYCSIYINTQDIEKTALFKSFHVKPFKNEMKNKAHKIYTIGTDLFNDGYETTEIIDLLEKLSNDKTIVLPITIGENLVGFATIIFENSAKDVINIINIAMEYFNSRLEVLSLKNALEETNKQKIHFLASISHEYKTPLNSIIGFSDILKPKIFGTPEYKYIDNISKSSRFLLSLIQDILDVSRAEFKTLELSYSKIRPKSIIENIILSFEETIKKKNVKMLYTLMDVEITADLRRFQQLIYNLISNAIKFNKVNGTITIVTYIDEKQNFVFEIKDTGDGIRKKDYNLIFNFFSQVNRDLLKRQQGSGIGLALCKMIINAHKGSIGFKSKLKSGSTFWFKLPMNGAPTDK